MSESVIKKNDRRSFLRGSALFAAALGMSVVPAFAQEKPKREPEAKPEQKPEPKPEPRPGEEEEKPADPLGEGKSKDGKLYDKEGREPCVPAVRLQHATSRAGCGFARTAATPTWNRQSSSLQLRFRPR